MAKAKMDDVTQRFDVEDTEAKGDRTKYAALVRAILNLTPNDVKGFITCALRYTLTLEKGVVTKCTESLKHTDAARGYHDDDYTPGAGPPRLGRTSILGTEQQKADFETLLQPWFEFAVLGRTRKRSKEAFQELKKKDAFNVEAVGPAPKKPKRYDMINKALSGLVPDPPLKSLTKLSMKVDVYTDRTVLGWHKDFNDGHALILGLLNVSDGPIGSTELFFHPQTNARKEKEWIDSALIRPPSKTRLALLKLLLDNQNNEFMESRNERFIPFTPQEIGKIQWLNDVVWIHRTPPLGLSKNTSTLGQHNFDVVANNQFVRDNFSLPGASDLVPGFVHDPDKASNKQRYTANTAPVPPARMLLRLTIRDTYEPCAEVWYDRQEKKADRKMWFRFKEDQSKKWQYKVQAETNWTDLKSDEMSEETKPSSIPHKGWCLRFCTANRFYISDQSYLQQHGYNSYVPYNYRYGINNNWQSFPYVAVPCEDMS